MKKRLGRVRKVALATAGLCAMIGGPMPHAEEAVDCSRADTLCVDVQAGQRQEFLTIQAAVDKAGPGDTVVVFPGDYAGFRVTRSGTAKRRITVQGRTGVRITAPESASDDGVYLRRVDFVTVRNFEVLAEAMTHGIAAHDATANKPMRGLEILDNVVVDAAVTGIYMSQVSDSLIAGNSSSGAQQEHGIYLANAGSDNTTLRGNVCYSNAVNGIHFNGDARLGGDGVHTGLLLDGNVLFDNDANGFDVDGVRNSSFVNNLVFDNGRHALRAFAIDAAAGPANLVIANNTFVGNGGWAIKLTQDDGGHEIFNNILLSRAGSLAVSSDVVADYNVAKVFSLDGENTVIGLQAWRSAGHGANSFAASKGKLFAKPNKTTFNLKASSPAVDAGVKRLGGKRAPSRDRLGLRRPQAKVVDIGAHELSREGSS